MAVVPAQSLMSLSVMMLWLCVALAWMEDDTNLIQMKSDDQQNLGGKAGMGEVQNSQVLEDMEVKAVSDEQKVDPLGECYDGSTFDISYPNDYKKDLGLGPMKKKGEITGVSCTWPGGKCSGTFLNTEYVIQCYNSPATYCTSMSWGGVTSNPYNGWIFGTQIAFENGYTWTCRKPTPCQKYCNDLAASGELASALSQTVKFSRNSCDLTATGKAVLDNVVPTLKKYGTRVWLRGFSPSSMSKANCRAKTSKEYLAQGGCTNVIDTEGKIIKGVYGITIEATYKVATKPPGCALC